MSRAFPDRVSRRGLVGGAVACLAPALGPSGATAAPQRRIVTLLGDSITAGYGLPAKAALPWQLEAALGGAAAGVRVRGAGVSGDTAADGLARLDFSVQPDTDVCVVVLGGNDLLQGGDPARVRANLDRIVKRLKARRIGVVLAGLKAPPVIGARYAADFDAIYPAVARANGVPLLPNLLAGVALNAGLNQRDGIHPNAAGVKIIAAQLAPVVARALKTRR